MTAPRNLADAARIVLACLDLTSLNDGDTEADIAELCGRAAGPFGHVAAVCVWPRFAAFARRRLPDSIAVAAVANFPAGGGDVASAVRDVEAIVASGAQEIDVVLPFGRLAAGDEAAVSALLQAVRAACPQHVLKVILETGVLERADLIERASQLSLAAGADFLKTSTGKTAVGATLAAADVMLQAIAASAAAPTAGFKASGGVRRVVDALPYIDRVEQRLGSAALGPRRLRFGASSLLGDVEAVLGGAGDPAGAAGNRPAPTGY